MPSVGPEMTHCPVSVSSLGSEGVNPVCPLHMSVLPLAATSSTPPCLAQVSMPGLISLVLTLVPGAPGVPAPPVGPVGPVGPMGPAGPWLPGEPCAPLAPAAPAVPGFLNVEDVGLYLGGGADDGWLAAMPSDIANSSAVGGYHVRVGEPSRHGADGAFPPGYQYGIVDTPFLAACDGERRDPLDARRVRALRSGRPVGDRP